MSKLTRRGLLGAGGSLLGLTACNQDALSDPKERILVSADGRPGYPGNVSFDHGVASGDPLPDRVILWTRVTPDPSLPDANIPVSLGIFTDEAMTQPVAYSEGFALASRDYTVKVDADDLQPDTVYYYRFIAKTTSGDAASVMGRTKTTAASGEAPVRLAIASCAHFQYGRFHVYRDISAAKDLDAVIHLGDYFYEYGMSGPSSPIAEALNRNHQPPLEIITLSDYRTRHAQYKTDPDLQAAHAAAPWLCTWDDHESANNSYHSGAQNHNPEENEGNWSDRKQAAVQAYLEWMPIRDPVAGRARENIYRRFDFGDIASVICLDSRLTGRSDEISWYREISGLDSEHVPDAITATLAKVEDQSRTMLGAVQEDWLAGELQDSTAKGKAWQVLANQVIMARIRTPNFHETLTPDQISAQDNRYVKSMIDFSPFGLPSNLDAWDGFPAARDRLYASAEAAGAHLVTLTGDTHTAWANTLRDRNGQQRGVEFGCASVTTPGMGDFVKDVPDLGEQFAAANPEVDWNDHTGHGWTLVTLTRDEVTADYQKVSDITAETYTTSHAATFVTRRVENALSPLERKV